MRGAGQGSEMRESAMQDADPASRAVPASHRAFPLPAFRPRIPHRVESPHSSLASPLTSVVHREGYRAPRGVPSPLFPLFVAALLAGTMNAAAGGGSFVTLPALVFAGVPSIAANATSTVALVPGALAGAWAYRHDAKPLGGVSMRMMFVMMLAGGFTGAMLLLYTPSRTFDRIIPWLLLFGSLVFTFGPRVNAWLRRVVHIGPRTVLVVQFLLGTYASYFGGAVGIMMLAAWGP